MTGALWRWFDEAWYLCAYAEASGWLIAGEFASAEAAYVARGAALGHAPNPFFHERWYLDRYPVVRDAVHAGRFASGFDHFSRHGYQDLMPHWLFDPGFYRSSFREAFGRDFDPAADGDPYDHFLRTGQHRGLSGHWLFDPRAYSARAPYDVAMRIRRDGPFTAFLLQMGVGGMEPTLSNLFDPDWYRTRYPDVAREIGAGRWESALHHYLTNTCPGDFDPSPRFNESDYAIRFTAVARAISDGGFRNGFDHFLRHGRAEGRYYVPSIPEPPLGARLGLRTRSYERITFLPAANDPRSPTGRSFGVLSAEGQTLWEFGHPRLAMRTGNENHARLAGTFIYGGVLINHFGHFLTEGLAALWYLRMRPDLPVLWNRAEHPIPHDLWPDWSAHLWDLLGLNQHRHHMIESPVSVDRLILPDPGLGNGFVHERQARALAVRQCPDPPGDARVWLSRSELPPRFGRLGGEQAVEAILASYGWTVLRPETMTVGAQADVFATASAVAGWMGSAFHAVLLCANPRARLILATRPGLERTFFDAVARTLRLDQCYVEPVLRPYDVFGPEASYELADPAVFAAAVCVAADR